METDTWWLLETEPPPAPEPVEDDPTEEDPPVFHFSD